MVAYRFCRPDDIPLLVRALDECWRPHFPGAPPVSEATFRRWMKHLDVWPSNSMVALDGTGAPIAVSIGTKRPDAVLLHRLAARPGHQRQGHGRHLVTSLSQKLAVLGPECLVAEVPLDDGAPANAAPAGDPPADSAPVAFFDALGWSREEELGDRVRAAPAGPPERPVPDELMVPVTVSELEAADALEVSPRAPWGRSLATLRQRADELVGIAVATPDRIEAYLLSEPFTADEGSGTGDGGGSEGASASPLDVLAVGCRDDTRADFLLGLLFRWLSHTSRRPLRIPRVAPRELPSVALAAAGFEARRRYLRYAARAQRL